jgi:hypothetical protein
MISKYAANISNLLTNEKARKLKKKKNRGKQKVIDEKY